ncbi:hypothetical protein DT603_10770 [Pseudoxanthomonas gei]|uniref:EF-hand domain-containing protein n=1 Tax=Pseudoxanthomonas gei TaxID=1383030 RepID=A0ABX0AJC0_9GAMM|nr:hypothetical protein [Pseudoxanthomonas gei]NDK39324.1 hypothetical protein [Pseudoxanthomonas gei]
MKHITLVATLFAVAFAASAQTSPPATSPAPVEAAASNPDAVEAPAGEDAASDRGCLKETGSRIAPTPDRKGRKCINASGRAYDRKDIDRTGAIDLKDALRRLDPAVH